MDDILGLINEGIQDFKIEINPNFVSKIQLYLTGIITKGVKVYGIGSFEMRAGFLIEYKSIVNRAIENQYSVFVIKEGTYFGKGCWYLDFRKIKEDL